MLSVAAVDIANTRLRNRQQLSHQSSDRRCVLLNNFADLQVKRREYSSNTVPFYIEPVSYNS